MKTGKLKPGKMLSCLVALIISPFLANVAYADLRVCNTTQDVVGLVVGYRTQDGWVSRGWWKINPISCVSPISGSLSSRFYYIYAETPNGENRWEGPVNMCIMEEGFEIKGVSDCYTRGYQKAGFQEIDTGSQKNWMIQLSGSSNNPSLTSSPVMTDTNTK